MNRLIAIHMMQQPDGGEEEEAIQTWPNVAYLRAIYAY